MGGSSGGVSHSFPRVTVSAKAYTHLTASPPCDWLEHLSVTLRVAPGAEPGHSKEQPSPLQRNRKDAGVIATTAQEQAPMPENFSPPPHEAMKHAARAWFETLRDRICAAFEAIEDEGSGSRPAGRFQRSAWQRPTENGSD